MIQYVENRNKSAHESQADFARLLLSKNYRNTHIYETWKDIFPLLYGGIIDKVAGEKDEFSKLLLLEPED